MTPSGISSYAALTNNQHILLPVFSTSTFLFNAEFSATTNKLIALSPRLNTSLVIFIFNNEG